MYPHSFSSWRKRMRRARWKKKPLRPNLPVRASLGMRTVVGHDRIKPARSHPGALYLGNHPAFKPQAVTFAQIPRVPFNASSFSSRCRSVGEFPKRGPQPPLLVVLRGGLEGESRNPPPMSLFDRARPFLSPREKWGRICPAIIMAVTHPERMPPPSFENTHTPVFSPCASCILASHSARRQWGHTATRT